MFPRPLTGPHVRSFAIFLRYAPNAHTHSPTSQLFRWTGTLSIHVLMFHLFPHLFPISTIFPRVFWPSSIAPLLCFPSLCIYNESHVLFGSLNRTCHVLDMVLGLPLSGPCCNGVAPNFESRWLSCLLRYHDSAEHV